MIEKHIKKPLFHNVNVVILRIKKNIKNFEKSVDSDVDI